MEQRICKQKLKFHLRCPTLTFFYYPPSHLQLCSTFSAIWSLIRITSFAIYSEVEIPFAAIECFKHDSVALTHRVKAYAVNMNEKCGSAAPQTDELSPALLLMLIIVVFLFFHHH